MVSLSSQFEWIRVVSVRLCPSSISSFMISENGWSFIMIHQLYFFGCEDAGIIVSSSIGFFSIGSRRSDPNHTFWDTALKCLNLSNGITFLAN